MRPVSGLGREKTGPISRRGWHERRRGGDRGRRGGECLGRCGGRALDKGGRGGEEGTEGARGVAHKSFMHVADVERRRRKLKRRAYVRTFCGMPLVGVSDRVGNKFLNSFARFVRFSRQVHGNRDDETAGLTVTK